MQNDFSLRTDGAFIDFGKRCMCHGNGHVIFGLPKGLFCSDQFGVAREHPVNSLLIDRLNVLGNVGNAGGYRRFNRAFFGGQLTENGC